MVLSSSSILRRRDCLTALLVAVMCVVSSSSASAAIYTWALTSGTGDWTNASNWNPNTAYPSQSGTDNAFITGSTNWTGDITVNLTSSLATDNLRIGNTAATSGTLYSVTLSTSNGSTLRMVHATNTSGTSVLNIVGGNNLGKMNLITPDLLLDAATFETRSTITQGAGIGAQLNVNISGNVSGATAGNKIIRSTLSGSTAGSAIQEYSGNITNGSGTVSFTWRNDMVTGTNTLKLSGTGNTFTGGVNFIGGGANRSILEASPASGANGVLSTGLFQLGTGGSTATLNMGGSLSTVTEVCGVTIAGSGARRIAVIGAGNRILSGTVNQATTGGLTLACASSGNLTLSNTLTGAGPITISSTGSGKVIFGGVNTHTGTTTISQGTLQLDGSMPAAAVLSVGAAGLLAGSGTASGTATIGGTLSPGATTGVLSLGSLVLSSTSTSLIDLLAAGSRGTDYDGVTVLNGSGLTYGGTMSLAFGGSILPDNTTFNVFSFTGATTGSFAQIASTGYYAGTWTDNLDGTYSLLKDAQTLTFSQATGAVNVMAVPEPASLAMVAAAAVAYGCRRRSRKRLG
ncbi:MAG: beta strand repeat-containing protein [Planctomycetaceae bacterium]